MTKTENSRTGLLKTAAGGWLTGLCLIALFVFSVQDPDSEWGNYWRVRPLLLTPLVAGMGAMAAYFIYRKGAGRILFTVLAAGAFLFSLWIGIILGLDGTLWD